MGINNKIKTGENTDVMLGKVINFRTIETESRDDDNESWNSLQFYGEDDGKESQYQSPTKVSSEALSRIKEAKAKKIGYSVLGAMRAKVA